MASCRTLSFDDDGGSDDGSGDGGPRPRWPAGAGFGSFTSGPLSLGSNEQDDPGDGPFGGRGLPSPVSSLATAFGSQHAFGGLGSQPAAEGPDGPGADAELLPLRSASPPGLPPAFGRGPAGIFSADAFERQRQPPMRALGLFADDWRPGPLAAATAPPPCPLLDESFEEDLLLDAGAAGVHSPEPELAAGGWRRLGDESPRALPSTSGALDSSDEAVSNRSPLLPSFASAVARRKRRVRQPFRSLTNAGPEGTAVVGLAVAGVSSSPRSPHHLMRMSCPNPLVSPSCGGAKRRGLAAARRTSVSLSCDGILSGRGWAVPEQLLSQSQQPSPGEDCEERVYDIAAAAAAATAAAHCSDPCQVDSPVGPSPAAAPRLAPSGRFSPLAGSSREHLLPTVENLDHGLPNVLPETVAALLHAAAQPGGLSAGSFPGIDAVEIVDCRYPFEYAGGHVRGASNLHEPGDVESHLDGWHAGTAARTVVLFYCEFCSQRAPRMFRHVRNLDRLAHLRDYPLLAFPNMFCIQGGYKRFHEEYPELCEPAGGYTKMADPAYTAVLREMHSRHKEVWRASAGRPGAARARGGAALGPIRRSLCSP